MSIRFLTGWDSLRLVDAVRGALVLLRLVRRPDISGFVMDHHPSDDALREGELVVVADGERTKWACFRCPGGCGGKIQLTLNDQRRPHWTASLDWLGRPTLHPSIRQLNKCGCHFWVRGGHVEGRARRVVCRREYVRQIQASRNERHARRKLIVLAADLVSLVRRPSLPATNADAMLQQANVVSGIIGAAARASRHFGYWECVTSIAGPNGDAQLYER